MSLIDRSRRAAQQALDSYRSMQVSSGGAGAGLTGIGIAMGGGGGAGGSGSAWSPGALYANQAVPVTDPLKDIGDADLIFEMIGRGYAVAKMAPEELAENL